MLFFTQGRLISMASQPNKVFLIINKLMRSPRSKHILLTRANFKFMSCIKTSRQIETQQKLVSRL